MLKKVGILCRRYDASQGLVQVVVCIHQTRQDDFPLSLNNGIGVGWEIGGRANGFNDIVARE